MKFEIFDDAKNEEKEEKIVRLKLEEPDEDGNVRLVVVDDDGDWVDELLYLNKDGTISLCTCVGEKLGFQLDDSNRIKVGIDR